MAEALAELAVVAGVGDAKGSVLDAEGAGKVLAERIAAVLGESAMNIFIRLSSFILVCIGVQISWNGLSALLRTVLN